MYSGCLGKPSLAVVFDAFFRVTTDTKLCIRFVCFDGILRKLVATTAEKETHPGRPLIGPHGKEGEARS